MAILYIFGNKRGGGGDSEIVSIFHRVCSKNGTEDLLVSRYEIVSSFFLDYKDKVWKILRFVISIHVCTGYKAIMLLSVDMKICESNLILNFVNHSHLVFNLIYIEFNQWTRWKSWTGSLTLKDQIWETAAQIQLLLGLLHDNDNERLPPTGPLGTTPSRRRDGKFRFTRVFISITIKITKDYYVYFFRKEINTFKKEKEKKMTPLFICKAVWDVIFTSIMNATKW